MAIVRTGSRIAREGQLGIGCSAAIVDDHGCILLTRRADNGRWCVPGGYMEPGESLQEAAAREVYEETGLNVRIGALIAVYTDPHALLCYPDGNHWQLVIHHFAATVASGAPQVSPETTAWRYVSEADVEHLELGALDRLRIADTFAFAGTTRVYAQFISGSA